MLLVSVSSDMPDKHCQTSGKCPLNQTGWVTIFNVILNINNEENVLQDPEGVNKQKSASRHIIVKLQWLQENLKRNQREKSGYLQRMTTRLIAAAVTIDSKN